MFLVFKADIHNGIDNESFKLFKDEALCDKFIQECRKALSFDKKLKHSLWKSETFGTITIWKHKDCFTELEKQRLETED